MQKFHVALCILLTMYFSPLSAQSDSILHVRKNSLVGLIDSTDVTRYKFIHFERNNIDFYSDQFAPQFDTLYNKLIRSRLDKGSQVNIYHIGGSHLQADIHSHEIRTYLQQEWSKNPGERGLVFPYNLAKTNNPGNYRFTSSNTWKGYRSTIHRDPANEYGMTGIYVESKDTNIHIDFEYKRTSGQPGISKLTILHQKKQLPYDITFINDSTKVIMGYTDTLLGTTTFYLSKEVHTFSLSIKKWKVEAPDSLVDSSYISHDTLTTFQIYGFILENSKPGISYSSIGINGAGLYTYLANKNFVEQLKIYPPDLFIFSVGTNDANVPNSKFDPSHYKSNLEKMMKMVWESNPNCAIILTVPNDSYYQKKYLNRNVAKQRTVIIELAKQYQVGVWDFYGIMGELGSSKTWKLNKLMQADYVHFTGPGYVLKGKLFSEAFLKMMAQFNYKP